MSRLFRPSLCSLLSALALGLAACGEGTTTEPNDDDEHQHTGTATGATCPTGNTLTYENFGQPFMNAYCISCHSSQVSGAARGGAPVDHNYDSVADVRRWATDIDVHAAAGPSATNTEMPPALPRPSQDDRLKLGQWLACGAP